MALIVSPVTVEIDIPVTRRTKIHAVVNGNGEQIYHSRRLSDVFDFLVEHEVVDLVLLDDDVSFLLTLRKQPPALTTSKG